MRAIVFSILGHAVLAGALVQWTDQHPAAPPKFIDVQMVKPPPPPPPPPVPPPPPPAKQPPPPPPPRPAIQPRKAKAHPRPRQPAPFKAVEHPTKVEAPTLAAVAAKPVPPPPPDTGVSAKPIAGRADPPYPEPMLDDGQEGAVDLQCTIDASGHATNCSVTAVEGGALFGRTVLNWIEKVRYAPATHNGQPIVESNHPIHIDFRLR